MDGTAADPQLIPISRATILDVTADGQRFLVNARVEESTDTPITVVLNWLAALKK